MTYTKHRSTQETLQTLDSLELDTVRSSKDDLIRKFNWENDSHRASTGRLPFYKHARMIIWQLFEESRSSTMARVNSLSFSFHCLSSSLIIPGIVIHFNHLHTSIDNYVCSSNNDRLSNSRI